MNTVQTQYTASCLRKEPENQTNKDERQCHVNIPALLKSFTIIL